MEPARSLADRVALRGSLTGEVVTAATASGATAGLSAAVVSATAAVVSATAAVVSVLPAVVAVFAAAGGRVRTTVDCRARAEVITAG
ncbi:MAG: hypothetical protein WBD88_05315, partial [Mycobacterium sp.]